MHHVSSHSVDTSEVDPACAEGVQDPLEEPRLTFFLGELECHRALAVERVQSKGLGEVLLELLDRFVAEVRLGFCEKVLETRVILLLRNADKFLRDTDHLLEHPNSFWVLDDDV